MPFKKLGPNKYQGPSGKIFDEKQVKLYYANGGKFPKHDGRTYPMKRLGLKKRMMG